MPIKVTCACGQSFAAKDELAGRTVKCPKCSRPLAIPSPATGAAPAPSPTRPAAMPAAPATVVSPTGSLFDEVGIAAAPVGTAPCPGCHAPMPMGAVLCLQCGYNVKLGRRMETMRIGADGEMSGRSVTDVVLDRAARALEEEKEEEKKKTREGLPWWGYLLLLLGLGGFMLLMMFIPQENAIMLAGGVLMFVGWAIALYSGICFLIVAFKESPLQGVLCMFVPFYSLVYLIMHWEQCAGFFFMNLGGTVLMFVGWGIVIIGGYLAQSDQAALLPMIERASMLAQSGMPNLARSVIENLT